jgi:hypothetical protein
MHDRSSISSNWPTTEFAQFKNWQSLERKNVAHFNFEPQSAWINYGKQRLYFPTTCRRLVARLHEKRVALERFWCAGGAPVKSLRCCLILTLLGLSSSAALADGIPDPNFGLAGGHTTTVLTSPTDPAFIIDYAKGTTTTAACGPPYSGHIACFSADFINDTGQTFTSISFDITAHTVGLHFFCNNAGDPYFDNCNATTDPITGDPVISFFGTTTHPGILPATSCGPPAFEGGPPTAPCAGPTTTIGDSTVNLYDFAVINDVSDAQTAGDFYHAQGSATVPEPPSVLLVLAGGMLLLFIRSQGISVLRACS